MSERILDQSGGSDDFTISTEGNSAPRSPEGSKEPIHLPYRYCTICWKLLDPSEYGTHSHAAPTLSETCCSGIDEHLEGCERAPSDTPPSEAISKLRRCLAFFASVIKSGEPWTEACQQEYEAAMKAEGK